MLKEEQHWHLILQDYGNNPADGMRGKGLKRRSVYVDQDQNIKALIAGRLNRHPLDYLRSISYRLPDMPE
jgi:hypothetical protein